MEFFSPLRYPGGKGKVAEYFKHICRNNSLYDNTYVEFYAGGASVALSLLFNEYATKIIINDKDKSIYAFWHSAIHETEELIRLINDTPVTIDSWSKQKRIQKEKEDVSLLELGFSTFFLNRTNRSGIISAGVIGGNSQAGDWKINARYNKTDLIYRIQRISHYKNRIEIFNSDALDLIKNLRQELPPKSLFYFDPPYYVKGKDLYLNHYGINDHKRIAEEIDCIVNQKWIVTYDYIAPICELYKKYAQKKFSLSYSAAKSSIGQEIMIFSNNLQAPDIPIIKAKQ